MNTKKLLQTKQFMQWLFSTADCTYITGKVCFASENFEASQDQEFPFEPEFISPILIFQDGRMITEPFYVVYGPVRKFNVVEFNVG